MRPSRTDFRNRSSAHSSRAKTPAITPTEPIHPPVPIPPRLPSVPITLEQLEKLPISSVRYYEMRKDLLSDVTSTDASEPSDASSDNSQEISMDKRFVQAQESRLLQPLASSSTEVNAESDTLQDVEPSVVSVVDINGTHHTATTFIKFVHVPELAPLSRYPRIHSSSTTDFSTFHPVDTPGQLPIPDGFLLSADPLMAVNPYSFGIAPRRMYCTGILFNPGKELELNSIGLWRSDDGGRNWSGPTIIAYENGGGFFLDKPAIAVSWYSGNLGYVYLTWVKVYVSNPSANSIWIARSTDGGLSFSDYQALTYDKVQGPQVVVDSSNGYVYAMWVNWTNNDIRSSRSPNQGVNFEGHEVVGGGNLLMRGATINGNVRANTLPMARFNWSAARIMVVWHGYGEAGTDIYYAYKGCTSNCNPYGWEVQRRVNDGTTNDQFMPAIDFYSNGNVVIPFYDRRDTDNLSYHQYFAYIYPDGTAIPNEPNRIMSSFASNPTYHTEGTGQANFVGDYQDVWVHEFPGGEKATSSWIGIRDSVNIGDPYLSRISP